MNLFDQMNLKLNVFLIFIDLANSSSPLQPTDINNEVFKFKMGGVLEQMFHL